MRTNIDIEDQLMKRAMRSLGVKTKKATVEEALRLAIQIKAQEGIRKLRGIGGWEGNLAQSRLAHGEK